MNLDKAKQILTHIAGEKKRWGKHYDPARDTKYTLSVILDAVAFIAEQLDQASDNTVDKAELTKVNRQLAASKARETGLKTKLAKLKEEYEDLNHRMEGLKK